MYQTLVTANVFSFFGLIFWQEDFAKIYLDINFWLLEKDEPTYLEDLSSMCLFISSTLANQGLCLFTRLKSSHKKSFGWTSSCSEAPTALLIITHHLSRSMKIKILTHRQKTPYLPSCTPISWNEYEGAIFLYECRLVKWSVYGGSKQKKKPYYRRVSRGINIISWGMKVNPLKSWLFLFCWILLLNVLPAVVRVVWNISQRNSENCKYISIL